METPRSNSEQPTPSSSWTKKVLTLQEAIAYTGFSRRYLQQLVQQAEIPYSKPTGKTIFFSREKLENWLLGNPTSTKAEIEQIAKEISKKRGGR